MERQAEIDCLTAALKRQMDKMGFVILKEDDTMVNWAAARSAWEQQGRIMRQISQRLTELLDSPKP